MKATVTDDCTACGLCVDLCPEVFEMGSSIAQVKGDEVPADVEEQCREAADGCPAEAILIEE